MMNQHIGPPAVPVVKTGDSVKIGSLVGSTEGKLGSDCHSSVNGKVISVTDMYVIIKKEADSE